MGNQVCVGHSWAITRALAPSCWILRTHLGILLKGGNASQYEKSAQFNVNASMN
ncbi:hypothetical protein DPMN_076711 [Dreissena polymorpha]|uniref:Uncharacterized protein n=1 Tax=Dreissena polymorpha TaxID=45954 RepID=A0A9D4BNL9_DREPO|nr:hypothetical protein DPMN_076711 [Dreissena polymorpha]